MVAHEVAMVEEAVEPLRFELARITGRAFELVRRLPGDQIRSTTTKANEVYDYCAFLASEWASDRGLRCVKDDRLFFIRLSEHVVCRFKKARPDKNKSVSKPNTERQKDIWRQDLELQFDDCPNPLVVDVTWVPNEIWSRADIHISYHESGVLKKHWKISADGQDIEDLTTHWLFEDHYGQHPEAERRRARAKDTADERGRRAASA